jgi:2-methylcitrate dehydratase PrpD
VLEGPSGLLAGHGARERAAELTRGLGREWDILGVVHKPAPACFFVQAPCQIARDLAGGAPLDPASVESVEIRVAEAAQRYPGCDNPGPMDAQQAAIMSLQFSVAAVLVAGGIRAENWRDFSDPAANALAARATVVADPALTAAYPGRQGAAIRVRRRDGGLLERAQDDFRSMSRDEVIGRFLAHAEPALGRERASRAVETVARLEALEDVGTLARLLRA